MRGDASPGEAPVPYFYRFKSIGRAGAGAEHFPGSHSEAAFTVTGEVDGLQYIRISRWACIGELKGNVVRPFTAIPRLVLLPYPDQNRVGAVRLETASLPKRDPVHL